jgi:hypothetical protein
MKTFGFVTHLRTYVLFNNELFILSQSLILPLPIQIALEAPSETMPVDLLED